MKNEYLDFLTELYADSAAFVGIYNMELHLLYKNKALKKHDKNSEYDRLDVLLDKKPNQNGLYYFQSGKNICTLNVIIMADKGYIVAEQIYSQNAADIFAVPVVDDYLTYIFSKIRETVSSVSISLDEIYKDMIKNISNGNTTNVDCLNTIDGCMLELLNEIIDPEILINLAKNSDNEKTVCVSDIVDSLAVSAEQLLASDVKIYKNIENGIYARVNKSYFDVIISDIVGNIINPDNIPESLIFGVKRTPNEMLRISIEAEGLDIDEDDTSSYELKNSMFYSYICDMFCKKYNGEFTKLTSNSSIAYRVDIKSIPSTELTVSSSFDYKPSISRFGPMSLRLRAYNKTKRFDIKSN